MEKLTPKTLLKYLGIPYFERTNRLAMCCPFHDDRNPSAGFYIDSERFFCYTCSLSLDMVGFVAKKKEISRTRAEVEIESAFGEQPKREQETRQDEADRVRRNAERNFLELKKLGLKECVRREEQLERILWEYETGQITKRSFDGRINQWINENSRQEQKVNQQIE